MLNKSTKTVFHLGIRQKVLLSLVLFLLTSLTLSGWFGFQKTKENISQEINLRGTNVIRFLSKSLVYSVVGYDYHTIDLLLTDITQTDGVGYVKVANLKGNTMGEFGSLITNDPTKMVVFTENLRLDDEVVGSLTVGLSTERIYKRLESQKYNLIKREAFIVLLIALGEFVALSYIIIRPVSLITKSLNEHENENGKILGTIPIMSNDEFGELAYQFNELSYKLNIANSELQSRIDYADSQLIKTNNLLLERSSELMDLSEEFKKISVTDPLTGIYNRRYFEEALTEEMNMAKRHGDTSSLLIIDIDNFKNVNDTYGHLHGDNVIKMIADIMKKSLRVTDVLCRIGGEEFVAICKRASKDEAIKVAEMLRKTIGEQIITSAIDEIKVTISIGIATVTKDNIEIDAENIFNYADIALYHSKKNGRNRVTHYSDMT